MNMDEECYKRLNPWMVKEFEIPNTIRDDFLNTDRVGISVVDSPVAVKEGQQPIIAVLIVPIKRQNEWIYTTPAGLVYLISKYQNLSRLVLLKNVDMSVTNYARMDFDPSDRSRAQERWTAKISPLLLEQAPVFVTYENNLKYATRGVSASLLHSFDSARVEDVEICMKEGASGGVEMRRRMRFRSTPGVLQAECRVVFFDKGVPVDTSLGSLKMRYDSLVDTKVLIQPHLQGMVYGLTVISPYFNFLKKKDVPVNVLSLGFGVGLLERFMHNQLGFKVVGVDIEKENFYDPIEPHFRSSFEGNWDGVVLKQGVDAIELVERLINPKSEATPALEVISAQLPKFQVITLDITTMDKKTYPGLCAPPRHFLHGMFIQCTSKLLAGDGALIMNVISPDFLFYKSLLTSLTSSFKHVYKVSLDNVNEFVIVATDVTSSTQPNVMISSSGPSFELGPSSMEDEFVKTIASLVPQTFKVSEFQGSQVDGY